MQDLVFVAGCTYYRIKIIVLIQKGNFKIVVLILLSEVMVQTTNLPPLSILGIAIVALGFLLSFVEREIQNRAWSVLTNGAELAC